MARPETQPKTPLACRLRQVRRENGDPDRAIFASKLGIGKNTIAFYERGERTPDASVLDAYRRVLGIDLNWLVSGATTDKVANYAIDNDDDFALKPTLSKLVNILGGIIREIYVKEQQVLKVDEFQRHLEAALDDLMERVEDLTDAEEVEAVFPQITVHLRKKIRQKTANPALENPTT